MSPKGSKILDGSFYRDELLKTKLNVDDIFRVEKVLKVSADGKREFVKWLGYPKAFNSWITRIGGINSEGAPKGKPKEILIQRAERSLDRESVKLETDTLLGFLKTAYDGRVFSKKNFDASANGHLKGRVFSKIAF